MSTFKEVIGDFRVVNELGTGAVGAAYRAAHLESGEEVAIKVMHDRLTSDPDIQNRFVREASVLDKLDHKNIVRHIDCGIDEDGRLFLVMEWVDFGSMEDVLRGGRKLPWRESVECAVQICEGLAHAHERGIIHRDLKPANLFLSGDGLVKIGDFGLARDAELHRLTQEGNTVGSCKYMAPEQIRGEDELTGAVDMYAVGCLLYRMIEGHVPYEGETIIQIFEHHLYTDIPKLSPNKDRPKEIEEIVAKLLTKDIAERPVDAGEIAAALQAVLDGESVETEFTGGEAPASETDSAEQASTDEPAPEPPNLAERLVADQPGNNVNWKALLIVLGVIAAIAIIVAATWGE